MLIAILPLVAASNNAFTVAAADMATPSRMRTAQVQLADTLASADAIDRIAATRATDGSATITFVITRGDHRVDVVATSDRAGDVIKLAEHDRGFETGEQLGSLSWLGDTMRETVAVTRLEVDEDGAVTLTTDEGMRYMAIPGRGSGGNAAAEAHWAGDFDHGEG